MGKLDHDPQILHFSHPHPLELNSNHQTLQPNNTNTSSINPIISTNYMCASCKLPANSTDNYIYSCNPCNFHLHLSCIKFPQLITHASHVMHSLTLLPVSSYPGGLFNCDACNRRGNGFSYHCHICDFDLHVVCASKPLSIVHYSHNHPLLLTFKNPYETKGFSCDICLKIGSKQWLYRCGVCEFDAHLHCATGSLPSPLPSQQQNLISNGGVGMNQVHVRPSGGIFGAGGRVQQSLPAMVNRPDNRYSSNIQTHQSFPATTGLQYNGITGGIRTQHSFPATVGRPNNYYGGGSNGGIQPQHSYPATAGGGIMSSAIQGLVEGAAQQVGQNLMQSLIGGDGSTSSIYVNLGPTLTGNQDSSETPQDS